MIYSQEWENIFEKEKNDFKGNESDFDLNYVSRHDSRSKEENSENKLEESGKRKETTVNKEYSFR